MTGTFLFILGIFGIVLPWLPKIKKAIARFFLEDTVILTLFGLGFALIGFSVIFYAFFNMRRSYIFIRTGSHSIAVDAELVRQYLEIYWQKNFPDAQVPFEITLKKHVVRIVAELPSLPISGQKLLLEKVKEDFGNLFERLLGYTHEIHLYASFKPSPISGDPR